MSRHPEFSICTAFVRWWDYAAKGYGADRRQLLHVPNQGSHGSPRTGAVLKAMGVRAGAPDYFLAVPAKGFHGLWIEAKSPKGRLSPEQIEFLDIQRRAGYGVAVVRSTDEARMAVDSYLKP